ncbi:beta-galactosidase-like [Dermacentor andersoni]|uniref:beta-galactosidase-like n=1 Tax=Dermacentor andersoni TaxID=34620 RepID=UPI003B3A7D02
MERIDRMRIKSHPTISRRVTGVVKWLVLSSVGLCLLWLTLQKLPKGLTLPLGKRRPMWFPSKQRAPLSPFFAADYDGNSFVLRGKRVQIMSGAIHYFRILPELWKDRLMTMQASGLNTIETYVEWSSHEPEDGQYDFEGQQDLARFLRLAHRLGFMVILRPGPYICAERDFGGLPYWLLRNGSSIRVRTTDKDYLYYVDRFLSKVFEKVRPFLISNDGPVIMVQLENEYGSYDACDPAYMVHLRNLARTHLGPDVVLFTTDGYQNTLMLKCGRVPGTLTTVDFGTDVEPETPFAMRRRYQAAGPLMNSEMYTGWLDNWGLPKSQVETSVLVKRIRQLLSMNASFNLYMFHGGTNFGFKSGANDHSGFQPQITSYDYDAPISEAGDATEKFKAIRELIDEFFPGRVKAKIPPPKKKMALADITMKRMFGLKTLRQLMSNRTVNSTYPLTFEQVGHAYGLMLYETMVPSDFVAPSVLKVDGIRDRGYVYVDDVFRAVVSRADQALNVAFEVKSGQTLSILVENQGRINMGAIVDPKGIINNVTLNNRLLSNWTMRPIDLTEGAWLRDYKALEELEPAEETITSAGLAVYAANFILPDSAYDTFLLIEMFRKKGGQAREEGRSYPAAAMVSRCPPRPPLRIEWRQPVSTAALAMRIPDAVVNAFGGRRRDALPALGIAILNGFNLGRYWTSAGPQKTLYVPSVLFRDGGNLLLLLELEAVRCKAKKPKPCSVDFVSKPRFDGPLHWPV